MNIEGIGFSDGLRSEVIPKLTSEKNSDLKVFNVKVKNIKHKLYPLYISEFNRHNPLTFFL